MKLESTWIDLNIRIEETLVRINSKLDHSKYFPPQEEVLSAFEYLHPSEVKVVIIGQDPYHGLNQAHGLAFSVKEGQLIPPSLKNIFKAVGNDFETPLKRTHGNLTSWAEQGVLLLNRILTVEPHQPLSHQKMGWEVFTQEVIKGLTKQYPNLVFMLWGTYAQQVEQFIQSPSNHLILKSSHPSPLSAYRGFFNCKHFSKCNAYLVEQGKEPVDWYL